MSEGEALLPGKTSEDKAEETAAPAAQPTADKTGEEAGGSSAGAPDTAAEAKAEAGAAEAAAAPTAPAATDDDGKSASAAGSGDGAPAAPAAEGKAAGDAAAPAPDAPSSKPAAAPPVPAAGAGASAPAGAAKPGPGGAGAPGGGSARNIKRTQSRSEQVTGPLDDMRRLKRQLTETASSKKFKEVLFGLDMPDQTVDTLSQTALVTAVSQLFIIAGWIVFFGTRDWEGKAGEALIRRSRDSVREAVAMIGLLEALSLCSTVYGALFKDRGWLMMSLILEIALLNTIHLGFNNDGVRVYSAFVDALCIGGAWVSYRLSEKIQEESDRKGLASTPKIVGRFKWLDLPDQTARTLRYPAWVLAGLQVVVGIVVAATHPDALGVFRGIIVIIGGLVTAVVTWQALRRAHLFGFVYQLLVISYTWGTFTITIQYAENQRQACVEDEISKDANAALKTECEGLIPGAEAQVVFMYLAAFSALLSAWINIRISEKLQTAEEDASTIKYACFGRAVEQPLEMLTKVTYCLLPLQLIFAIWCYAVGGGYEDTGVEAGMPGFHFTLGTLVLVGICCALYAALAHDRGYWIMFLVVSSMQYAVCFLGLAHTAPLTSERVDPVGQPIVHATAFDQDFLASNPLNDDQKSRYGQTIAVFVFLIVLALAMGFVSVDASEFIQEGWRGAPTAKIFPRSNSAKKQAYAAPDAEAGEAGEVKQEGATPAP